MENFFRDLRYGIRMLAKRPGFTLVAVLTLALAIGANTTIFTWVKGVLLNPLPGVEETDQLLTINGVRGDRAGLSNSYPEYEYYRDHNTVFSGMVAYEIVFLNLGFEGRPDVITGGVVSGNYFDMLGVRAAIGRTFLPEEDLTVNTHPVVVLGHNLWQRRFGGDREVAGKTITLNGNSFTIIGVAPQGFTGTYGGLAQELWVPLHMQSQLMPQGDRLTGPRWLQIMGRLKPRVTQQQAQAELNVLANHLAQERPATNKGWNVRAYTLVESQRGIQSALAPVVKILMVVVGLVLLIACANIGSLLLARAVARRKEIAIRLALGGSRARLARQLLTESLLLALLGGAAGFVLAIWMADLMKAVMPPMGALSVGLDLSIDGSVLAFTLIVTLATGIIFGLVPAIQSSNPNVAATLTQESGSVAGGRAKSRLRSVLVVAQIALSCVALIGAGLFIRSLRISLTADPGFDLSRVAVSSTDLFLNGYDEARGRQFYNQLIEKLEAASGIETASFASYVPLATGGGGNSRGVFIEGYTLPPDQPSLNIVCDTVGPNYMSVMGMPLAAGREFTSADRDNSSPVAIINEAMARRYWPDQDALGKRLRVSGVWHEVVGIAKDTKYRTVHEDPSPRMYLPALQDYESRMIIVARSTGDPASILPAVQNAVRELDANLPLLELVTLEDRARDSLYTQRTAASLLSAFGLLALALSAAGLYGVMSYLVSQHSREIGIRVALGAQRSDVLKLILGQGMVLTFVGVTLGLVGAFSLTRLAANMLYGVTATDPLTFISVSAILLLVALAACYIPARRAARVDPMVALRYE